MLTADRARLAEVRRARATQAAGYFATHAATWDEVRAMHIAEETVETAIHEALGTKPFGALLDVGTGTGRMLELLAPQAGRALGIDQSPQMLGIARDRLSRAGLRNAQLRQGDIFALPVERDAFDVVVVHQVLHYLDDPAARAARGRAHAAAGWSSARGRFRATSGGRACAPRTLTGGSASRTRRSQP